MSEHDKEKDVDSETGVETTGHEWDGIKELNNPLPRWWLWTFYLTIAWGLWYVIAYPAWPLINGATAGYLGFSTRANVAADIAAFDEKNADLRAALTEVDLTKLEENEELSRFAVAGGRAVFLASCSQCHGSGAAGATTSNWPHWARQSLARIAVPATALTEPANGPWAHPIWPTRSGFMVATWTH